MTIQERARRVLQTLDEADAGNYGRTAWYSYMRRDDVEALARAASSWQPPSQLTLPLDESAAVSH